MNDRTHDFGKIAGEATRWLTRRDGGFTAAEELEFARWRAASPLHAEAVAEREAVWAALDRPRDTGHVALVRGELRRRARSRRRWTIGLTSTLAAACVTGLLALRSPRAPISRDLQPTARMTTPARTILPDGSIVEFNKGGRIESQFDATLRRVVLLRGEAHFEVMKDSARPFVVVAGSVEVRAVGTAFAVRHASGQVEVLVTEGKVEVERPAVQAELPPAAPAALVAAGSRIVVPTDHQAAAPPVAEAIAPAELDQQLAWRRPHFEFTDTSIAEAIVLFNRRSRARLEAADAAVAGLRVTGIFRADNADGFVNLLAASFGVRVERPSEDRIVLQSAR